MPHSPAWCSLSRTDGDGTRGAQTADLEQDKPNLGPIRCDLNCPLFQFQSGGGAGFCCSPPFVQQRWERKSGGKGWQRSEANGGPGSKVLQWLFHCMAVSSLTPKSRQEHPLPVLQPVHAFKFHSFHSLTRGKEPHSLCLATQPQVQQPTVPRARLFSPTNIHAGID